MRNTIILLAAIALTGCNRGGFDDYTHKPDPQIQADADRSAKAARTVTASMARDYYSKTVTPTEGRDVAKANAAPGDVKATSKGGAAAARGALPPTSGSLMTAGRVPTDAEKAATAVAVAKSEAERARLMRVETRKALARNAAAAARNAVKAQGSAPGRSKDADVTLPATGGR